MQAQVPPLHVWLAPQVPQEPPQPSSPQALPAQLGVQHALALHTCPEAQQALPQVVWVQAQLPLVQLWFAPQVPQEPPQPSSPQVLPLQLGEQGPQPVPLGGRVLAQSSLQLMPKEPVLGCWKTFPPVSVKMK